MMSKRNSSQRPKWWPTSLRSRLILALSALTVAYCAALLVVHKWQEQEAAEIYNREIRDSQDFFTRLLEVKQFAVYAFTRDLSGSDEMVSFLTNGDTAWAYDYLDHHAEVHELSAVWVLNKDLQPIYYCDTFEEISFENISTLNTALQNSLGNNREARFYVYTEQGVMDVCGTVIHESSDTLYKTPKGYLFVGKLWDAAYLKELGQLANGDITVTLVNDRSAEQEKYNDSGEMAWSRFLRGWDKQPVASMHLAEFSWDIEDDSGTMDLIYAVNGLLTLTLVVFVGMLLTRWVIHPLKRVSESLNQYDVAPVFPLLSNPTELGNIARLIQSSIDHRNDLMHEIERRKVAERMLYLTKYTIEHANLGVSWVNYEGQFIYANEANARLTGYTLEELLTMKVRDLIPGMDSDGWMAMWNGIKANGGSDTFEGVLRQRDGTIIPTEASVSILFYDGEEFAFAFVRDISERKRAEYDREALETQLRRMQKLETIGTLAGGVAHDFNNILTPILGYSDMVLQQLNDESPIRQDVEQITKSALRAKDLVKQILTFSRQGEQERRAIQVHLILKEVMKLLRASLPSTIEIHEKFIAEGDTVLCDPTQIHQVLMNLGTNAYHAMKENGGILDVSMDRIEVDEEFALLHLGLNVGSYVRLTVCDTGCGMDRATLERIFEPFFTTKGQGEGTGLGLSLVHGIVLAHGGGITTYSEVGVGSTFRIYLPSADEKAVNEIARAEESPRGSGSALVVDDEADIVQMAKRMLERNGYVVTSFTNSEEALERFRKHPDDFDFIVTDQTMPRLTGDKLVGEILAIRPNMPIIMVTGFSERVTAKNFRTLGIREFVMKPLVARDLLEAVRRAISGESVLEEA